MNLQQISFKLICYKICLDMLDAIENWKNCLKNSKSDKQQITGLWKEVLQMWKVTAWHFYENESNSNRSNDLKTGNNN